MERPIYQAFAAKLADALQDVKPTWAPQRHQVPPDFDAGDWLYWIFCGGRGTGKTDAGSYAFDKYMTQHPGHRGRVIAPTLNDAVESCVIGPSGLRAHNPAIRFNRNESALYWPNGSRARLLGAYTPEDVERLRANTNSNLDWCEELAAWPKLQDAWDQSRFGLRQGQMPRTIITTTPKPKPLLKKLLGDPRSLVVRATIDDNKYLSQQVRSELLERYGGTTLGRQELYGELIEDLEGALWTRSTLEDNRRERPSVFQRIVVAIDPAVSSGDDADETGIIVAGLGADGHGYILDDLSCRKSPDGWATLSVLAYYKYEADRIVGEVNNGGEMVGLTVKSADVRVPFKAVHASRGKRVRAEPVAALYEQGRIHHVGVFPKLEDQMAGFVPEATDSHDDRVDALVWAIYELMLEDRAQHALAILKDQLKIVRGELAS